MVLALLVVTLIAVIFLSYLLFCENRLFVRRNAVIDLPIDQVGDTLIDLTNWPQWLPWLIYEKDIEIQYEYAKSGVTALPSCLKWQGKLIKEGFLSLEPARSSSHYYHTLLEAPAFYPNDLHFNIDLTKQGGRTLITLQITAKVAFFKRWTSQQQIVKANRDLELALLKLTAHLEQNSQTSPYQYNDAPCFEWLCCAELDNMDAVTRPFIARDQPLSQKMEQGFHDLMIALGPENLPAGPCFALYNKANPTQHYFSGRLGVPIQNIVPCDIHPEPILLTGRYLQIRYTGSYQNLSLAWHVIYNYMRLYHRRRDSHRPGVEIFEVGPMQSDSPRHFVTKVCLPIK